MQRFKVLTLAGITFAATLLFSVGSITVAHASDAPATLSAGSYSLDLPGGGTLGFDVAADGTISITVVPDGFTSSAPTLTDEGFKVTLTDATGTVTRLVEVQAESEDGQVTVKAEENVNQDDQGDQNSQGDAADNSTSDTHDVQPGSGDNSNNGADSPDQVGTTPAPTDSSSPNSGSNDSNSGDSGSSSGSGSGDSGTGSGGGDN